MTTAEERHASNKEALATHIEKLLDDCADPSEDEASFDGLTAFTIWQFEGLVDGEDLSEMVAPEEAELDKEKLRFDLIDLQGRYDALIHLSAHPTDALVNVTLQVLETEIEQDIFLRAVDKFEDFNVTEGLQSIAVAMQSEFKTAPEELHAVFSLDEAIDLAKGKAKLLRKCAVHLHMLEPKLRIRVGSTELEAEDLSPALTSVRANLYAVGSKVLPFIFS